MGLFDKRKKGGDDFDSPVENIDLSAPPADPAPAAPAAARSAEPTLRDPDPEPPEEIEYDAPAYGIDDAIQLMRALPQDNVELVVQVVKRTLESTNVKTRTIIDDASRKQGEIESRIDVLKKEIAEFEQEISTRKEEITKLEADHKETTQVKDRLQLAEKLSTSGSPAPSASQQAPRRKPGNTSPPLPGVSQSTPARRPGTTNPPSSSGITSSATSNTASGTTGGSKQTTAKGTTIVAKK